MEVLVSKNFFPEKKYILDVILGDFLGLKFSVKIADVENYEIKTDDKKLIISDLFWSSQKNETYLTEPNVPSKVDFVKIEGSPEKDFVLIFGKPVIKNYPGSIFIGVDIFASAFFMLSRWEEIVINRKDKHGRFDDSYSLAQKAGFHTRPVVNEYVEFLWYWLKKAGCKQKRKTHTFEIVPTYDIDFWKLFSPLKNAFKVFVKDLLKYKSPKRFLIDFQDFIKAKSGSSSDPFFQFDYLMNVSEEYGTKSHFFFIAGKKGEPDFRYNFLMPEVKTVLEKITSKGHFIGIHSSYSTLNNEEQFARELERFKHLGFEVEENRQHYLRLQIPQTWQILEKYGIKYDYSLGYTNTSGFRAGVCFDFPLFDPVRRKKLDIIERPLIFMETTTLLTHPRKDDFYRFMRLLKSKTKKYSGKFVFLWHNSSFYNYPKISNLYKKFFE